MAATYQLRFPLADQHGEYVLVQATSTGSRPLDLTLVGTDGAAIYTFALRSDRISKYREKSAPCTEDEWESILKAVLTDGEALEDFEVSARVHDSDHIEITFKKKIEQFSQRLGTLTFKHNEAHQIELFDWCVAAIGAHQDLKTRLVAANEKAARLEAQVAEREKKINELVEAKKGHEEAMLENFQTILNEKKVKIRQQQRLLASTNLATEQVATAQSESETETKPTKKGAKGAKQSAPSRPAGPSRRGKRKAELQIVVSEDEDSDDGFEKMEVDTKAGAAAMDEDQMTTEDEETASDTDMDDDEPPPPVPLPNENGAGKAKIAGVDFEAPPSQNTRHKTEEAEKSPPPRRLPFGKNKPSNSKPTAAPAADRESETESDDEL